MRALASLGLVLALIANVGCQNSSNKSVGGPRASLAAGGGTNGLTLNGTVTANSTYQSSFQSAVTGFLSTDVNPAYVGTVSATPMTGSGVFFGGQVTLSSGSIRTMLSSSSTGSVTGGRLMVQVYDASGGAAAIPPVVISNATGYVQGSQASIQFYDDYGSVTMQGQINSTVFTGTMSYDNSVNYDGSTPGAAGTLGTFSVPLCQFFSC